ncbi:BioY family transporter [Pelagivirga sediminicola]|uniref:Biotin transporter n=1 Tax=Pelagivirga sediminicola TaxID=2170575 RepID=A0A2T7G7B7_9RHOB|nr:biotin transporter BioY [Pelagivirga sediminicola]PVA10320.1 BioY family transporter [Pelagivirga sediminicola]
MERNIALIALFAALIAALGLVPAVMLPFGVPITAQSLGVMLCGTVLGARRGTLAVLLFLLLVFLGLPLLSGGKGGLGVIVGPTGGFVIGFPAAAFVAGLITERWRRGPVALSAGVAAAAGGAVLYAFGIIGMSLVLDKTPLQSALLVTAFIPGDAIKAVIAGLVTSALYRARPRAVLSRA